jgi:methyl-accepting chemotaxis protein
MGSTELQTKLRSLATQLARTDSDAAGRLLDISEALEDGPRRRELAYLDVRAILDPQGIEERAIVRQRPGWLSWVEWLRNVLVLFPIAFTWIGLSRASSNYNLAVTQYPDLVNQPFLLLWERGFQEMGGRHGPTFSELALFDFVVLFVVIGLTVVVHRWRDVQEGRTEKKAAELRSQVEEVIWELDQQLAADKSAQDIGHAAEKVGDAVDRFRVHAHELLDIMVAERRRLEGIATSRERELSDLQLFSDSTAKLLLYGESVERVYDRLQGSIDRFTDEIQKSGQQQELLLRSLDSADMGSRDMAEAVRVLRQGLATAVSELGTAASRSGDNLVGITGAMDEMRDLASRLVEEDTALRKALLESREANREITKNLQAATTEIRGTASVTQLAASTLRQGVNELTKLIQTNGDMAHDLSQSAGQMTQVAQDLGATTLQATSQLKSTSAMSQQAASTLSQVAAELTKMVQSNGDLARQLTQSAGQMTRAAEDLGATTGAATAAFKELHPVADQLHGTIGVFSHETRRFSEALNSAEAGRGRLMLARESRSSSAPVARPRLLFAGLGVAFGLGVGVAVEVLILLGLVPVLR